jgi:DNA-binding PadR family transcriptional regulator
MFGLNKHKEKHEHKERRFAREGFEGRGLRRHGGRHGAGRMFDHGNLRFAVLGLIAEKPRLGYEVIKAIEEACGGTYSPSPGVVYPTLTMLEELGYLAMQEEEGGKKRYAITPEGNSHLQGNRPMVDQAREKMAEARQTAHAGRAPEIQRAMHNLQAALAVRTARGALTTEDVRQITALLDRAAAEIEQG